MKWARWFEKQENRQVKLDYVGDIMISTIFLGFDHNFMPYGSPILFETMVFGEHMDQYQERYSTWNEAIEGHNKVLEQVHEQAEFWTESWPKELDESNIKISR